MVGVRVRCDNVIKLFHALLFEIFFYCLRLLSFAAVYQHGSPLPHDKGAVPLTHVDKMYLKVGVLVYKTVHSRVGDVIRAKLQIHTVEKYCRQNNKYKRQHGGHSQRLRF